MSKDYLTIISSNHDVLLSAIGNFNFDEKERIILSNDVTAFVSKKSPLFNTQEIDSKNGKRFLRYYPEMQDDNE